MKRCNGCGQQKSYEDFHKMKNSPDGRQYKCKPCVRAYKVAWEAENAERVAAQRRRGDIRRYGIEPEDYDRMLLEQGGLCAICRGPEPVQGHNLHVDHCHASGKVRGLLCGRCNRALGMFKDDVAVMQAAIEYLLQANAPSVALVGT